MELISKEGLMSALVEKGQSSKRYKVGENWELNGTELREVINGLKVYHTNRPQGRWVRNDMFQCDQCGYRMIVGDGAYDFCPNCGARMRGEE